MNLLGVRYLPYIAVALLLLAEGMYPVAVTAQKVRAAHSNAPTQFQYVCPMHEDVKSKTPGRCPKCKMKLEKRRIKESA
jgi:heavy metal-binding protein